jgi:anti-sigma regulatory factor (Ser/Thr protein kinase)
MDTACEPLVPLPKSADRYRHEAFFYRGVEEFLSGSLRFIGEAMAQNEPILVVVSAPKIDALKKGLRGSSEAVAFADMADVGSNPARIISAWQRFLSEHSQRNRPVHGIGEPIWAERGPEELAECQRHEELLNLAFTGYDFRLMCPYDESTLPEDVLTEARRTHPLIHGVPSSEASSTYAGAAALSAPDQRPLPPPPHQAVEMAFDDQANLYAVRRFVHEQASRAGLASQPAEDLVLAANEMTTNSLRYGGGSGTVKAWSDSDCFVLEFSDGGRIHDPMIGRLRPDVYGQGGRGFWLANHLCDLVQIRAFSTGTVVRLHRHISQR